MATSVVKLYHGTNAHPWMLTANKFFVIDDIVSYLSTYSESCLTLNNFQYQKCALELAIVCDLSQHNSEPLYSNGIKYVSIQNSDAGKIYYYYVKKAEWRAKQSVKLYLVMDVANTFRSGTDFDFTERTKITREHKNRFTRRNEPVNYDLEAEDVIAYGSTSSSGGIIINEDWLTSEGYDPEDVALYNQYGGIAYLTYIWDDTLGRNLIEGEEYQDVNINVLGFIENGSMYGSMEGKIPESYASHTFYFGFYLRISVPSYKYERKIDYQSEGLSPILYKKNEQKIERSSLLNVDWYLLYRNQNEPTEALTNPVECYLIPSEERPVNIGSVQTGGRIKAENLEYGKYYYIPLEYHGNDGITITLSNGTQITKNQSGNVSWQPFIVVQKASDNSLSVDVARIGVGSSDTYNTYAQYITEYFNVSILPCYYMESTSWLRPTYASFRDWSMTGSWTSEGVSPLTLDGIDKLDRTDAKNIKLIKLPYVPYDFQIEDNKIVITDTDFEHVSLTQTGGGIIEILKLKNLNIKFNYNFKIGSSPLSVVSLNMPSISPSTLRNDYLESKIYHSDYYQPKFVYDSFGYVFQLERLDVNYYITISDKENMNIKYVISTTITSKFMFQFIEYKSVMGKEDYNDVMPVARNNEMVLYNVPYINYIRTGYNYDVKNKNMQAASTWASVGLGALGTATALMFPSVALKVAGVVASLISTAISVKNAVVNQVQAERNLDQKMLEAKNQSTSVSGADDVDLMSVYTENRAKMCLYECSDIMKALLLDLFFYTGYVSNRMGLPNTHTRLNFDYLEADIIITDHTNMSEEIMNELVGLYKNGLTFIHKVSGRTDMWDLEQKYENIELFMLE